MNRQVEYIVLGTDSIQKGLSASLVVDFLERVQHLLKLGSPRQSFLLLPDFLQLSRTRSLRLLTRSRTRRRTGLGCAV